MVISVDPVINMPIHYNTLSTLLQFSMFILSIFNCKGEQSAWGGEGRGGGKVGANLSLTANIFKTFIKNISLLCCC